MHSSENLVPYIIPSAIDIRPKKLGYFHGYEFKPLHYDTSCPSSYYLMRAKISRHWQSGRISEQEYSFPDSTLERRSIIFPKDRVVTITNKQGEIIDRAVDLGPRLVLSVANHESLTDTHLEALKILYSHLTKHYQLIVTKDGIRLVYYPDDKLPSVVWTYGFDKQGKRIIVEGQSDNKFDQTIEGTLPVSLHNPERGFDYHIRLKIDPKQLNQKAFIKRIVQEPYDVNKFRKDVVEFCFAIEEPLDIAAF